MPSKRYAVTGASGQLGRLVVAELAKRAGAAAVVAVVRDPAKVTSLVPADVEVRAGDYEKPDLLDKAFAGIDTLLLISSSALGIRVAHHRNAIESAVRQGVSRIAYTSVLHAPRSELGLADDHRQTEAMLAASGVPHILLRNGWYTENYAASIPTAVQHGAFIGCAADGRISAAARLDYAEAAAIAILDDDRGGNAIYELAGDEAFTLAQFAAEISRQADKQIPYVNMSTTDYRAALIAAGLPEGVADLLSNSDDGASKGALFDSSRALSRLIGRPTTPFAETIGQTLRA